MKATITASIFEKRRINVILGEQCRANINAHNRIVEKKQKNFVEVDKDSLQAWKAQPSFSRK